MRDVPGREGGGGGAYWELEVGYGYGYGMVQNVYKAQQLGKTWKDSALG